MAVLIPAARGHGLTADSQLAEKLDFSAIYLPGGQDGWRDPITIAEQVAIATSSIRIMVEVHPGLDHPLLLAESLASLDAASNGRVEAMMSPAPMDQLNARRIESAEWHTRADEATAVVRGLWACGVYEHAGIHWTIPALHPSNGDDLPESIQMTTRPNQLALPIWRQIGRDPYSVFQRDDLGMRAKVVGLERDMAANVAILTSMQRDGVDLALCRFAVENFEKALSLFSTAVAPRFRTVVLPAVILNQLDSELGP